MAEPDTLTPNEVIARRIYRLRAERKWKQSDLADRLTAQLGQTWDASMVSRSEWNPQADRPDRLRRLDADEIAGLAVVFGVSAVSLMTPAKGEQVRLGADVVPGPAYFWWVFQLPPTLWPEPRATFGIGAKGVTVPPLDWLEDASALYPALGEEMRRRVGDEGSFSGWATEEELLKAGVPDPLARLIASEEFESWLTGRARKGKREEE